MALFPLDIRTELHLAGAWTDISADVYNRDRTAIYRGRRDQGANTDPATLSITLNNRDGKYSPRNAMSPLYGLIGRNTRVRLSVAGTGEPYLQMEGDGSQFVSTPDTAALDITGDLDVRAELAPNWYGPENQMLIGKWDAETDQRSWMLRVQKGQLYFQYTVDGTAAGGWFSRWTLPTLPARAAVRVTFDADNGAGDREFRVYWAPTLAGPWTPFGTVATLAGPAAIHSGTAPLSIAPYDFTATPPRLPFSGRGYRFEVRNGINGTVVASPDFTAQAAGTTSFTDAAGRLWTLSDTAEIRDREDRFYGEISTWPAQWTLDGSDIWTPIQASGILRRLGQGQKPFDSTLRRRIPSGNPVAYWPFEENKEATRAYSPIPGVDPAAVTGVEFGALDTLVSSSPLPKLLTAGSLSAKVPADMASGQWQVEFVYNADDKIPADFAELATVVSPDGAVRRWQITLKGGFAAINGFDASGTEVQSLNVGVGNDVFHGWTRLRLWSSTSGGIVTTRVNWQDVGGDAAGLTTTYPGSAGRVSYVTAAWGPLTEGWGFGHLTVMDTAPNQIMTGSDDAFLGETAWERMARLAEEEQVPLSRIPGELPTQHVGHQGRETLLDLLDAAAQADGGMLLEARDRIGLVYRDRSSLYTQQPALTLNYAAPGPGPDLEPVDDDSAVRNDITITRAEGSAGRAFLAEGPLSTQAPPYGIGLYDEAVTLSLADDTQPEPIANWRLHLGTYEGARYPVVSLILHKPGAEAHLPGVLGLREGDMIRLTGLPEWVAHGDVDLIVQGWSETLDLTRWELQFNCSPGEPWNTAVAEHPVYGTVGSDGSVLGGPVTDTATTLPVRTTAGPAWTADPAEMPVDLQVGGEVVRLDAVGHLLNSNPWFTADTSGWAALSATVTWSTAVIHPQGVASALVVPSGAASASLGQDATSPAVAGLDYTGCYWVYSPAGWSDFRVSIDWYNAGGGQVGTSSSPATVIPAGQWTFLTWTATAPANTAGARVRARQGATPPPSAVWHAWGMRLLAPGAGNLASDTFSRTVANGWGTMATGQTWTRFGGVAADFSVNGTQGIQNHPSKNLFRYTALTSLSITGVEMVATVTPPLMPTGDGLYTYFLARTNPGVTTYYFARLYFSTTGVTALTLRKRLPTETELAASPIFTPYTAGQPWRVRLKVQGSTLCAKAWPAAGEEPLNWQVTVQDTDLPGPGGVGLRTFVSSSNTNAPPIVFAFDDFQITDSQAFTVTRSINGVVKAHPAGSAVQLAHPAIASL